MTSENSSTSNPSVGTASAGSKYDSLAALRDGHLALKRSDIQGSESATASDKAQEIRAFLSEAGKAGRYLSDPKERRAAQGIVDYWSAELVTLPGAKSEDFTPILLDAFEPERTASERNQGEQTDKTDQRALIRWSAFARQYAASNKDRGYLLTGDAIKQAARFRQFSPEINDLVSASENVEAKRERRARSLKIAAGSVFLTLACVIGFLSYELWYISSKSRAYIEELKRPGVSDDEVSFALRRLQRYQRLLPPYDLSGITNLKVRFPELTLYSPNFADVSFKSVSVPGAQLAGALFAQSKFSRTGNAALNDFAGADLSWSQFRGATILDTSFKGAKLYRAVFDRALLCNVDFSDANLRSASFWAVTMDPATKNSLKKTAWWQATGWSWAEIQEIAHTSDKEDEARVAHLRTSDSFRDDLGRGVEHLQDSASNTLGQALALSDIAWTRAVWGINAKYTKTAAAPAQGDASSQPPLANSCATQGIPSDARDAAERAVCIAKKLNETGAKQEYSAWVARLEDTLAYTLMQNGQMADALKVYDDMRNNDSSILEQGEVQFRHAIAEYFGGQDKATAVADFKAAIRTKRYQPSHELQTLKNYIFNVAEFTDDLKAATNVQWPPVPNTCPAASSSAAQ